MSHTYEYARPALTADAVVLAKEGDAWYVLLITRGKEPYKGRYAFPGGFFDSKDFSIEETARRELREETGLDGVFDMNLFSVQSRSERDPRERVVSVVFSAVFPTRRAVKAGDDAATARWVPVEEVSRSPQWAFDHFSVLMGVLEHEMYLKWKGDG